VTFSCPPVQIKDDDEAERQRGRKRGVRRQVFGGLARPISYAHITLLLLLYYIINTLLLLHIHYYYLFNIITIIIIIIILYYY